ncbi:imidazole glycerol phosphate synthase subunit HisH [bacterium]|jgi:imidazole glycerol-phosphate synthase subunit HisH|nr:imidazole glycerol phosphate synthase subunit HisH [bacterium]MBT3850343.1 imidazole glycerol phosphate synthase subunit HisH [bacterium]MBT4435757.1 imidazole glycerol phosphate synthase subunit HisH [bacterium]MDG2445742.1 imidazole glycerol phosphate synthase subunit HisH [Thermodesulfobacteriota bacterium]
MIAVVDYGIGNLQSVHKALGSLSVDSKVTDLKKDIDDASSIIFPGVGSFGDCLSNLENKNLLDPLMYAIKCGKPFLGICLGLQILFESSEESPGHDGLGVFKGNISKIEFETNDLKVPHMGWNQVDIKKDSRIFKGIPDKSWFYFVHSYKFDNDPLITDCTSEYGADFSALISSDNVFASQFHPEKSSNVGLQFLKNFSELN